MHARALKISCFPVLGCNSINSDRNNVIPSTLLIFRKSSVQNSTKGYFVRYDRLQKNAYIRLICINCCFLINSLDYVTSNFSSYLTDKETNLAGSKYKLLLKISNQLNDIESQKNAKHINYVSTDLLNAAVGFWIGIFVELRRVRNHFILKSTPFIFHLIDLSFLFFFYTVEETELVVTISFGTTHKGNAYVSN